MITLYAGAFAAVFGGILGWQQLGMPVPATQNDLSELRQEIGSNTMLILGQEWERLRAKIYALRGRLAQDPTNRDLHEELARAEAQFREVDRKLK